MSVISKNSKQHLNNVTENSLNFDNWEGDVSQEDSKIFAEKFAELKNLKAKKEGKRTVKIASKTEKNQNLIDNLNSYQKAKSAMKPREAEITNPASVEPHPSIKFNLNSEAYVPNNRKKTDNASTNELGTNARIILSNKPKHLALDDNDDNLDDIDETSNSVVDERAKLLNKPEVYVKEYKEHNPLFRNKLSMDATDKNVHSYSNSFVQTSNQFRFNTCPEEEIKKVHYQQYKFSFTETKPENSQLIFPSTTKSMGFPTLYDNGSVISSTYSNNAQYNNYGSNISNAITSITNISANSGGQPFTPKHQKFISDHSVNVKHTSSNQLANIAQYSGIVSADDCRDPQEFKSNLDYLFRFNSNKSI